MGCFCVCGLKTLKILKTLGLKDLGALPQHPARFLKKARQKLQPKYFLKVDVCHSEGEARRI